ncbi:MAG: hypothetical protein Kapaf2KO_18190 [Candidatus Kapaibacteriales bacterium]
MVAKSKEVSDGTDYYVSKSHIYVIDTITGRAIVTTDDGFVTKEIRVMPANLLLDLNGKPISDSYEMEAELSRFQPEDDLMIWVTDPVNRITSEVLVKKKELTDSVLSTFESALIIIDVEKGGVADKAGIKKGDIVLSINGKKVDSSEKGNALIENLTGGSIAKYEIIRGNERIETNVRLANYGVSALNAILFFAALSSLAISLFIGLKKPSIASVRLLSLAGIGIGNFIVLQLDIPDTEQGIAFLLILYLVGFFFFVPSLLLHSTYYLPEENKKITSKRLFIYLPYILAFLVMGILAALLITGDSEDLSALFYVLSIYAVVTIAIGVILNFALRPGTKSAISARTFRASLVVVPLAFILAQSATFSDSEFNRLSVCILAFIPLVSLYTLIKMRVIDSNINLGRNIWYMVARAINLILFLSIGLAIVFLISQLETEIPNISYDGKDIEFLDSEISDKKSLFWNRFLVTISSVLIVFGLYVLYDKIVEKIRKRFYRKGYSLEGLTKEIGLENGGDGLGSTLEKAPEIYRKYLNLYSSFSLKSDRNGSFSEVILSGNSDLLTDTDFRKRIDEKTKKLYLMADEFQSVFKSEYLDIEIDDFAYHFPFVVPIRVQKDLKFLVFLGRKLSDTRYRREDIELADNISNYLGQSLEKEELYKEIASQQRIKQEISLAREIQLASLPTEIPRIKGLDVYSYSEPAYEVGGDFFEYLVSEKGFAILLGDVSGKGTSAALYMSKAQGMISALSGQESNPALFLEKLNKLILPNISKSVFITANMTYFDMENRVLKYSRAGHIPLFKLNGNSGEVEHFSPKGLGLGIANSEIFSRHTEVIEIPFEKGDIFVSVSDGLIEAKSSRSEEYGQRRLKERISKCGDMDAKDISEFILTDVRKFAENDTQFDDITICIIKIID